jgi:cellulose biosynthesis protein BcsQ
MMDKSRGNMPLVIAMSNEKGGVAKTTSTLSLGAALAELNHRVLLIDLDPQANLSLALGLETVEVELTSASVLIDNTAIKSTIRRTEVNNLDLVPCNTRIESAEQFRLPLCHTIIFCSTALPPWAQSPSTPFPQLICLSFLHRRSIFLPMP